ncbi:MAG: aldehyde dehydrogenase family protein [Methanobacteriota archaeon]
MPGKVATHKLYIGGAFVDASGGEVFEVANPATNEPIATVAKAGADDARRAVEVARAAFERPDWGAIDPAQRGRILWRLATLVREHADELARLETTNQGKTLREAKGDVLYGAWTIEYYAGLSDKIQGATIPVPGDRLAYTRREPLGVTVHIVPWNYPFQLMTRSVAPALAAGNTCVVKPASLTPLTTLRFAELCQAAGVPAGVVNVVPGPGREVGGTLAAHPDVAGITVTGSAETGKEVQRAASEHVCTVTLELGGKSPNIVFPDANVERALRGVANGIFLNAGQMCWAGSRLLVHESIHKDFVVRLAKAAEGWTLGSGLSEATKMGPLVSREQQKRVLSYVQEGKKQGAKVVTGGEAPTDGELSRGNFVKPTILDGVANDMKVAREEIFGPVLSVIPFRDTDEAVRIANDTRFGLYSGIWTNNLGLAHSVAARLAAGQVAVNEYPITFPQVPFGGYKESGVGHEQGLDAIQYYTRVKSVIINLKG